MLLYNDVYDTGQGKAARVPGMISVIMPVPNASSTLPFVESPLAHPSVMFRRTVVERWGGYDDGEFPEDYVWLRWLEAGVRMRLLPCPA